MKDLRADKTLLQEKYNKIKDMTQGNATDASWNDFTRLRELANAILTDPNATPAEVSDILNQLNTFEIPIAEIREIQTLHMRIPV